VGECGGGWSADHVLALEASTFKEGVSMHLYAWTLRACVTGTLLLVAAFGGGWKWDLIGH
jgi:hypothetical protein